MINEYFDIYKQSIAEYGEKTCVFYACGSFYEVYKIENEKETIGNADVIADIIRCDFSNKNKSKRLESGSSREFPDFCGFGIPYLPKYITPLLENNYTVVVVDQLEQSNEKKSKLVKRGIVAVHSPCLKSSDFETSNDTENHLIIISIEIINSNCYTKDDLFFYSICSINNITNNIDITENVVKLNDKNFRICLDDMVKILSRYNIREGRIYIINNKNVNSDYYKKLYKYFDEKSTFENYTYKIEFVDTDKYNTYSKSIFQNEYLKRIYKHINFGLTTPLEYLNLQDKHLSVLNLLFSLDFIAKHDLKYVNNLKLPNIIVPNEYLSLELNTIHQLNITSSGNNKISSVFDVVNYTCTAIGKRHLKSTLSKPMINVNDIQFRYDISSAIETLNDDDFKFLNKLLSEICDIDKFHRKMGLDALHPYEFVRLHKTYISISKIFDFVRKHNNLKQYIHILNDDDFLNFLKYSDDYTKTFDLNDMAKIGLNTSREDFNSFFKSGIITEIDTIKNTIITIENQIEQFRSQYESIIGGQSVKLGFTDNDGYFFTCTKLRYQKLTKEYKDTTFQTRYTNNMCKFSTYELNKLSDELISNRDSLQKLVKLHYIKQLQEYSKDYNKTFENLSRFIAILDVCLSNVKCSRKNNYCKPLVKNEDSSWLSAKSLRHPIIEIINDETEYIPNDIDLSDNNLGMLVYGLNSSGKSSLLRSIGIAIILAQSGLYVPCKSFSFSPFKTLISQVDLTDNLFANRSSFTSEMFGLQRILSCSGPNTLVLSDELCRGTEIHSSCAIVGSTVSHLIKNNTKFFFTTHLHYLASILNDEPIHICHLSVETKNDNIIFKRRLQPGSGSDLYGLEVCKSIIKQDKFIDYAFEIRNKILSQNNDIIGKSKSRYNKKKITDHCQICNHKPKPGEIPLDTHHINEQRNCDDRGFVQNKHFHKNKIHNLVSLCKSCHQKIDTGELIIHGYVSSTSGTFLDYEISQTTY